VSAGRPTLNLDTHILLFALSGELTARERRLLSVHTWSISAIVLWEIAKLAQLGRIEVDLNDAELVRTLSAIHVWPVDLDICKASTRLDFSGDPADDIIAATSVVHNVPLVTRDRKLRKSRRLVLA
jgi:PIN domain nuclease of toxin-antitoxin system